jgi:hypothetical protein
LRPAVRANGALRALVLVRDAEADVAWHEELDGLCELQELLQHARCSRAR